MAGLGASLAESAHDTSSSPDSCRFFDVECKKASLQRVTAGSHRKRRRTVRLWTDLGRSKAGVTKWPGGEIGAENAWVAGSNPGKGEKMGAKSETRAQMTAIECQVGTE